MNVHSLVISLWPIIHLKINAYRYSAAEKLIAEVGFQGLSMQKLAKEAGVLPELFIDISMIKTI